jgi:uncharacterized protein (TIRG00374 family)
VLTTLDRLRSLHLTRADWARVLGLAFGNWLADAGVLAVSLIAVGAGVPWRGLLFAYGVGAAVGSIGLTPGGLGVVEGALTVALMGVGVRHGYALAAVLLYRFVGFWMVSGVGWLVYLLGRTVSSRSHRVRVAASRQGLRTGGTALPGGDGSPRPGGEKPRAAAAKLAASITPPKT